MKFYHLLILLSGVFILSCDKKDDGNGTTEEQPISVEKSQWGLAINYTATWCGSCGFYGAPLIHELSDMDYSVAMTIHVNDDPMMNQALYWDFASDRPTGGGIPSFWIGDKKTSSISVMQQLTDQEPTAAIGFRKSVSGSQMNVAVKINFYEEDAGDYYLSVLLLEDGIDGSADAGEYAQNGTQEPATYTHDFVLRTSAIAGKAYGEKIKTGVAANEIFEKTYSLELDPSWTNTLYPVVILWKYDAQNNSKYRFVNAKK
jgi:hypothetical protein